MPANRTLPTLNPLKARSTIAAVIGFLSMIGPIVGLVSPGWVVALLADIVANKDIILANTDQLVLSLNGFIAAGCMVWFWIERRAPNFRLSFRK